VPGAWEQGGDVDPATGAQRGVFIAVPTGGLPLVTINFAVGLSALVIETAQAGIPTQTSIAKMYNIDQTRNSLIYSFLRRTSWSHLFFIDSDCVWPPGTIIRLMSHNLPVCAGVVWNKNPRPPRGSGNAPAAWLHDWEKPDDPYAWKTIMLENPEGLYEVDWSCAAGVLIRRDALAAVKPPWCVYSHERDYDENGEPIKGFSEDHQMFTKLKAAGFPLVLDLGVRAKHSGMAEVGPDTGEMDWLGG